MRADSSTAGGDRRRVPAKLGATARVLACAALLTAGALVEGRRLTALGEYDIGWHVRTGAWILEHRAWPTSGLFSQYSERPWIAYSWGFEVPAAGLQAGLGLRALPLMLMALHLALAAVTFALARRQGLRFWPSVLLSAAAQYAMPVLNLRPVFLSMLFFGVLLGILFDYRRRGRVRSLIWLPFLFALWANVHIQFVYGLAVVALFTIVTIAERLRGTPDDRAVAARVSLTAVACVAATALTPYLYRPWLVAWQYARSHATYSYIVEMHAMSFRRPEDYVRVLLVLLAAFALGRRPRPDPFAALLLVGTALAGFHMQRDTWFLVWPAAAILAGWGPRETEPRRRAEAPVAAGLAVLVFAAAAGYEVPASPEALRQRVGQSFPVRACDFIRENRLPPPLYNPLNWGGFLIGYLPEYPVAIDGRTDLYGDDIVVRQYKVLDGQVAPWDEPTFASARTLLLERYSWLAGALAQAPQYRMVYRDERAIVFLAAR